MTRILPDAALTNWVDRHAPPPWRPWLKLARLDRPVGVWLLMLPGWQGVALAGAASHRLPDARLLGLFALGAVLMRAAGCALNDIVDRDIDARVARTSGRPVASGQISVLAALGFVFACTLASAGVLLALNVVSFWIAAASLPLVALYPFMKRITWWPQAWLGLTFNWGVLLGFGAALGGAPLGKILIHADALPRASQVLNLMGASPWRGALALYAAGIFWTLGYDTIYAIQDMADDLVAGVKSSALRLGDKAPTAIRIFYGLSLVFSLAAAVLCNLGPLFYLGLATLVIHFERQVRSLDDRSPARALATFNSNTTPGIMLFFAISAGSLRL